QEFQSSEPRYYQKSDKKRSKMKIAILSIIFVILLIGLFSFVAMAVFGNKYEEMPDLKGKTEKQAEKVLDSHHLKVGDISRNYSDK
ncbi:serine/threonine protein kinase, partial [Xylophilus sp. Kf1]|nr:serine/threonine protein kinase [Xylophilus sp. Kf1]